MSHHFFFWSWKGILANSHFIAKVTYVSSEYALSTVVGTSVNVPLWSSPREAG